MSKKSVLLNLALIALCLSGCGVEERWYNGNDHTPAAVPDMAHVEVPPQMDAGAPSLPCPTGTYWIGQYSEAGEVSGSPSQRRLLGWQLYGGERWNPGEGVKWSKALAFRAHFPMGPGAGGPHPTQINVEVVQYDHLKFISRPFYGAGAVPVGEEKGEVPLHTDGPQSPWHVDAWFGNNGASPLFASTYGDTSSVGIGQGQLVLDDVLIWDQNPAHRACWLAADGLMLESGVQLPIKGDLVN